MASGSNAFEINYGKTFSEVPVFFAQAVFYGFSSNNVIRIQYRSVAKSSANILVWNDSGSSYSNATIRWVVIGF